MIIQSSNYFFKVNNAHTRVIWDIGTLERRQWRRWTDLTHSSASTLNNKCQQEFNMPRYESMHFDYQSIQNILFIFCHKPWTSDAIKGIYSVLLSPEKYAQDVYFTWHVSWYSHSSVQMSCIRSHFLSHKTRELFLKWKWNNHCLSLFLFYTFLNLMNDCLKKAIHFWKLS